MGSLCSCPLTPVVSKASAGAMEVMDILFTDDLDGFLQVRAERLGWREGAEMSHAQPLRPLHQELVEEGGEESMLAFPVLL